MIDISSTFQQRQTPQCLIEAGPEAKEARLAPPVQAHFLPQKRMGEYRRRQSNPNPWDLEPDGYKQSCIL